MSYARPQKCIVFTGDTAQRSWAWPEDFRFWANSSYVRDSGTKWVRFWVSQFILQFTLGLDPPTPVGGEQVRDVRTSWDQLNFAEKNDDWNPAFPGYREPGVPYLQKLDRQIRAANDAGLNVILTIYPAYPFWVTKQTSPEPSTGKDGSLHHPAELGVDKPWGWFVGHLCARYRYWSSYAAGVAPNPYGPHLARYPLESTNPPYAMAFGNPSGGYISALEVCNEPNSFNWPQYNVDIPNIDPNYPPNLIQAYVASAMFYIAYQYAAAWGAPALLGPGTLDVDASTATPPQKVNYKPFNQQVIQVMAGMYNLPPANPYVGFGFSQHNYGDIKYGLAYHESRVRETKLLLSPYGDWHNTVWLTEGGYRHGSGAVAGTAADATQVQKVTDGFNEMNDYNFVTSSAEIPIFSQYGVNDIASSTFHSALRDNFVFTSSGVPSTWGPARLLHTNWKTL